MRRAALLVLWIGVAILFAGFVTGSSAQDKASRADTEKAQVGDAKSATVREEVRGGIAFRPEKRMWVRITGKVKVFDAHTLAFEDGTVVDISGMMEAPELEQKGLIDGKFYPKGDRVKES